MRVSEICSPDVACVAPGCTVRDAAETMRARHVGCVVVVDGSDGEARPVGLLTDRDIVVSVVAPGVRPDVLTVADVMTQPARTFDAQGDLLDAIRCMSEHGIRRLVLTHRSGAIRGILAADDAYAALTSQLDELARAVAVEQVREAALRD